MTGGAIQSNGSIEGRQCSEVVVNIAAGAEPSDNGNLLSLLLLRLHSIQEGKCCEE